jgi:sugar phosphate isomerase/epimerase
MDTAKMPSSPALSFQLYSARKFPPLAAQCAALAQCGYKVVETFAPWHEDAAATRALFDRHGLVARSAHFSLDMTENQPERVAEIARALGVDIIVAPYLPPEARPAAIADWKALGARLAGIGKGFAAKGLRFAWHNHDFEFQPLPDGSLPIEHVLGQALLWEADLAWVARSGADPALWIERYRGRMPLVHVKDIAPRGEKTDEDGWADVGAGILPWRDLWRQCVAAGAEIMVAEHDNPSDYRRFARVSLAAMRAMASGAQS